MAEVHQAIKRLAGTTAPSAEVVLLERSVVPPDILARLEAMGYTVVPIEPTEAMLDRMSEAGYDETRLLPGDLNDLELCARKYMDGLRYQWRAGVLAGRLKSTGAQTR